MWKAKKSQSAQSTMDGHIAASSLAKVNILQDIRGGKRKTPFSNISNSSILMKNAIFHLKRRSFSMMQCLTKSMKGSASTIHHQHLDI